MKRPFPLSPEVQAAANDLGLRCDGVTPASIAQSGIMTPSLVHFTVTDPESPAFRASFTVRLFDLSADALRQKHAKVVEDFTETPACVP